MPENDEIQTVEDDFDETEVDPNAETVVIPAFNGQTLEEDEDD